MTLPAKPISSPARTDELPPPLMRCPRSKSTRGSRSRANPMFVRKINTLNDFTQEPSSPKVTCIGQVQVRRSNNKQKTTAVRRCRWLRKLKPRWFGRVWRKNFSFFRRRNCAKPDKKSESNQIEANQINEHRKREIGDVIGSENVSLRSEPPPRNALLLTRSRSAPFRSSFASKIWESTTEISAENIGIQEDSESINGNIVEENGEDEGSINRLEEFKARSLNLNRCKSEPSRTWDKLFTSFSP